MDDLIKGIELGKTIEKKSKTKKIALTALAVVGTAAAIGGAAYAIYKLKNRNSFDFSDDFTEVYDEEYFEQ